VCLISAYGFLVAGDTFSPGCEWKSPWLSYIYIWTCASPTRKRRPIKRLQNYIVNCRIIRTLWLVVMLVLWCLYNILLWHYICHTINYIRIIDMVPISLWNSRRVLCSENYAAYPWCVQECPCRTTERHDGVLLLLSSWLLLLLLLSWTNACQYDILWTAAVVPIIMIIICIMNWASADMRTSTTRGNQVPLYIIIKYMMYVNTFVCMYIMQWKTIGFNFHVFHFYIRNNIVLVVNDIMHYIYVYNNIYQHL